MHPGQRFEQTAVLNEPAPRVVNRRAGPGQDLLAQLAENSLQQLGFHQRLSFGKTAQTHVARAHFLLDARQIAGRAQPPHRADHWVVQPQQKQREIIDEL
jgi:hypothetical protein